MMSLSTIPESFLSCFVDAQNISGSQWMIKFDHLELMNHAHEVQLCGYLKDVYKHFIGQILLVKYYIYYTKAPASEVPMSEFEVKCLFARS